MSNMTVGQEYSTSLNACILKFKGGPMDGQRGLFDHPYFNQISFSTPEGQAIYIPNGVLGTKEYVFVLPMVI